MASDGSSGSNLEDVQENIRRAGTRYRDISQELADARHELGMQLSLGRRSGLSWKQVAENAGVSVNSARFLVEAILTTGSSVRAGHLADGTVAVSVSEAARRLGITRPTVYAHIRRGLLRTISDNRGGTLVVLSE